MSDPGAALDQIVAKYQLNLKWVADSKDRLTAAGARVLAAQWGIFNRHSRRWAYVVGDCPHVEIRKWIVKENLYEEEVSKEGPTSTFSSDSGEPWGSPQKRSGDAREDEQARVRKLFPPGSAKVGERAICLEKEAALQAAEESMIAWKFYLDGICEAALEKES